MRRDAEGSLGKAAGKVSPQKGSVEMSARHLWRSNSNSRPRRKFPAEHLPLYAERDGTWVLDVDGAVEKAKLDEFRSNNVALMKERDELKQRFEGIEPAAVWQCERTDMGDVC